MWHLDVEHSSRGFKCLPAIRGRGRDETVDVYESSLATDPHIWMALRVLRDPSHPQQSSSKSAIIQLSAEDAWRLADQLRYLVVHHYHGDSMPAWAKE